jgi:hypothetical protein
MPRYTADLSKANAGYVLLEKGDYEFTVGEPKTFYRSGTNQQTGEATESYGIQYPLTVVGGDQDGKNLNIQLYLHTDKSFGMAKKFVMAALGYSLDREKEFNADFEGADWSFDTDTQEVGDIWTKAAGTRLAATADIVNDKRNPERQNQQFNWRPI